jgi:hypothetical protein
VALFIISIIEYNFPSGNNLGFNFLGRRFWLWDAVPSLRNNPYSYSKIFKVAADLPTQNLRL